MRAMILAAGRGVRMGSLTDTIPKPLQEIDGESLIARQVRRVAAAGITEVVINLSYRGDRIRAALGDGGRFGIGIRYSDEGPEALETAGGIIEALPLLGDAPFLVANADVVTDFDFAALAARADRSVGSVGLGTLVLVPNPAHRPGGDYGLDADARLTGTEPKYTFAGISVLSPELFAGLDRGRRPLSEIFETGIQSRALTGLLHQGLWFDVGTPERLDQARQALTAPPPNP